MLFPAHSRFNVQSASDWTAKADLYRKFNRTVLVVPSLFSPTIPVLIGGGSGHERRQQGPPYLREAERDPCGRRLPIRPQLLTTEGVHWHRHRKVSALSFSEKNTAQVWEMTMKLVAEWQDKLDKEQGKDGTTVVDNSEDLWAVLTLLVTGRAGFGIGFAWPWTSSPKRADEAPSFYQASKIGLRDWRPMSILPRLVFKLPSAKLQRVQHGYDLFGDELKRMVQERVEEVKKGVNRDGLLTALVKANLKEERKDKLTHKELRTSLPDAYIFLIAGHETTANPLSTIFLLLALYTSHQDALHGEALSVFGSRPILELRYSETYDALPITLATVQEGLRLAGPAPAVIKQAALETWLPARTVPKEGEKSEETTVFVPAGSLIRENASGVHYIGEAWPDPYDFNPKRLLEKDWNRDSFNPFSSGMRGCIGRPFAMAELVAVVSAMLLKYRIEMPENRKAGWLLREGETERERRERIMNPAWALTLGPQGIDLAFVPRIKKKDGRA
ncbi:hypothetical protein JCM21900_006485 [Sporobolomyces salmonicolor]